nr:hypothetical protein [Microbacterium hydrocarbonoxydans]
MTPTSPERVKGKDRAALAVAAACAVISVLIWSLWVLPIVRSIDEARSTPTGRTVAVELAEGETVGIWASGTSAALGTMTCSVVDSGGSELPQWGGPTLGWEDVLWWMSPRHGFAQQSQITSRAAGEHLVRCEDALGTYEGEFLVAADSFGSGAIGLGRNGGSEYPIGSILVYCAVICPLLAVLIPVVILLRRLVARRGLTPR